VRNSGAEIVLAGERGGPLQFFLYEIADEPLEFGMIKNPAKIEDLQ
jgi:hypothetical protein